MEQNRSNAEMGEAPTPRSSPRPLELATECRCEVEGDDGEGGDRSKMGPPPPLPPPPRLALLPLVALLVLAVLQMLSRLRAEEESAVLGREKVDESEERNDARRFKRVEDGAAAAGVAAWATAMLIGRSIEPSKGKPCAVTGRERDLDLERDRLRRLVAMAALPIEAPMWKELGGGTGEDNGEGIGEGGSCCCCCC